MVFASGVGYRLWISEKTNRNYGDVKPFVRLAIGISLGGFGLGLLKGWDANSLILMVGSLIALTITIVLATLARLDESPDDSNWAN